MPSTPTPGSFIRVGQIVGAWGLRGQVKILPLTGFSSSFVKGMRLRLDDDWVTVQESTLHKGRPLLKLEGVDSIERAEELQWHFLEAPEQELELGLDEYRTADLIGLRVETDQGVPLGKVDNVLPLPAHDVLVVDRVLIPAVKEFVLDVDLDAGVIRVRLIEGMIE